MKENPDRPTPNTPEDDPRKESVEELKSLFAEVEKILEVEGREGAKLRLHEIYTKLQELNRADLSDWTRIWIWNAEGDLTEAEFDELNLRRKKLSNAVGTMTASGTVRHDLNEI